MSDPVTPSGPSGAVRRAPFGDNPQVGARGQRTHHRVLDAALRVFTDVGVHQASVERIAREAGCSRAAFYQYFADRDDVLRHLADQLRLQFDAAVAWLAPIMPGPDGWRSLHDLLGRWAEIHARHRPVFDAFPAMFETDSAFATDAAQTTAHFVNAIAARVQGAELTPATVDRVVELCLTVLARMLEDLDTLRQAAPASFPEQATLDALTDVVHRALFGLDHAVNVHDHGLPAPPHLPFRPRARSGGGRAGGRRTGDGATRAALLAAARTCFLAHGFHGTRINTIAEKAGVSHGTLYTYFDSKEHVADVLARAATRSAVDTLQRMPDFHEPARRAALRKWLGEYNRAQAGGTAMVRVWAEALREGGNPAAEAAPAIDWGRRQIAGRLAARGFGDVEVEAAVFLPLLTGLGSRERSAPLLDAAALVIDRGFFGGLEGD